MQSAAKTRPADAFVEPPSVEQASTIGGVRVDGSLNLTYKLGDWRLGAPQGIPFRIVHRIRTTPFGESVSELSVTGLTAFAVPSDRSMIHCSFLGGGNAMIWARMIGDNFVGVGDGLAARRDPSGRLEVASVGGWLSVYEQGLLVGAAGPTLLRFEIESQGAKITHIRATRLGGLVGELTARYNDLWRVKELRFGSRVSRFEYSGPQGQMNAWTSVVDGKETKTFFEYKGSLLSRVIQNSKVVLDLQFERVPGGLASDSEWPEPIRVSRLGDLTYSYSLDEEGFHLTATNTQTHATQGRILNPKRGIIDEIKNGRRTRRLFYDVKRGQPDTGKIVRSEEEDGEIIEYRYNSLGQISFSRRTQGTKTEEIKFTYDQFGRHESSSRSHARHSALPPD